MAPALICPACRIVTPDEIVLQTLEPASPILLQCTNEACGATFPIVHGIAVVGEGALGRWLADEALPLCADVPIEVLCRLAAEPPDGQPVARWLEHLSLYVEAHWGDHAVPRLEGPFGFAALAEKLRERAAAPVDVAVELGCSVGRGLAELGRGATHVIGVDRNAGALRAAARLLRTGRLDYARRRIGAHYAPAAVEITAPATPPELIAGNALDPPLAPASADRVVAFNLLDAVHNPKQLLAVVDGLCRPGGEILLATPYAWSSAYVDDAHRFASATPERELREALAGYTIVDEADLPWMLRRDDRLTHHYRVHYLRATKNG